MAEECTESSVATSNSTPQNWWDINHNQHHHHPSLSYNSHWLLQNPNSNSSCEDDSSFTNASNHSSLTSNHLLHHPSDHNHHWTQVLLNIGNDVELQSNEEDIEANFLETISSRSMSTAGIFEPTACSDYLKKMDTTNNNNWDDTFQTFTNNNNNNNNGLLTTSHTHMLQNERFLKLSNLVNTWSIALPRQDAQLRHLMEDQHDHLRATTVPTHEVLEPDGTVPDPGLDPFDSSIPRRSIHNQNYGDYISFNGRLAKSVVGINGWSNNPCFKSSLNLSADSKKQIHQISSPIQQPKVKIGDRITALQQIVSPFGKTDTASVLTETIGYIKFLQEQVQLLSNPYMKTNSYKDPWQSLERKEGKGEGKFDLRSRGLCLVPISCTPQVYRENTGSDYWTPYRGCFYR
ncbi:transcription factor bHLH111 isoform X2 [Benincasa hispida]|uniref:transcription factor bHLH111 isoform X2 n=1 Tax=Benincasa hispida TaxID=102211 RepID=UPI001900638B|nr:transcription factor bHLH111 isoform X2 [Benincasa hispida]